MVTLIIILSFIIAGIAFAGLNAMTDFYGWVNLLGAAALGTGVFLALKPNKRAHPELKLDDSENSALLQQSFNDAVDDYNFINQTMKQLRDGELHYQMQQLQNTSSNIMRYLKKHPQKISMARRFIDYYQDTTARLLDKYVELEHTQLQTENVQKIKERTKNMLMNMSQPYQEAFEHLLNDQIMDMDAELKVMQESIKADGFDIKDNAGSTGSGDAQNIGGADRSQRMRKLSNFKFKDITGPNPGGGVPYKWMNSGDSVLKRKLIAGGLGVLFGGLGAHKFYLGKTGWGVLYLLFSWTGIPFIVGFIEGVRYIFMSSDDFYRKYYLDR